MSWKSLIERRSGKLEIDWPRLLVTLVGGMGLLAALLRREK